MSAVAETASGNAPPIAGWVRWQITCKTINDDTHEVLDEPTVRFEGSPAECFRRARWWAEDQYRLRGVTAFDFTMECLNHG